MKTQLMERSEVSCLTEFDPHTNFCTKLCVEKKVICKLSNACHKNKAICKIGVGV